MFMFIYLFILKTLYNILNNYYSIKTFIKNLKKKCTWLVLEAIG